MPIYEFKCEACQHCFEKLVFAGDEKHVTCPECGGRDVQKVMSATCSIGSGGLCGTGSPRGFS